MSHKIWIQLPTAAFATGLVVGLKPALDASALYLVVAIVLAYLLVAGVNLYEDSVENETEAKAPRRSPPLYRSRLRPR